MIDISNGVADVRRNRPEKRNALDRAQFEAIIEALETLASDLRRLRALGSAGPAQDIARHEGFATLSATPWSRKSWSG